MYFQDMLTENSLEQWFPSWAGHQNHLEKLLQIHSLGYVQGEAQETRRIPRDSNGPPCLGTNAWEHHSPRATAFDKHYSDYGPEDTSQQGKVGLGGGEMVGKDLGDTRPSWPF